MRKSQYFPFQCWVLNKGPNGTICITSLVWCGPWLGIEPRISRTRCQHSTTRLSRRPWISNICSFKIQIFRYPSNKRWYETLTTINVSPCIATISCLTFYWPWTSQMSCLIFLNLNFPYNFYKPFQLIRKTSAPVFSLLT